MMCSRAQAWPTIVYINEKKSPHHPQFASYRKVLSTHHIFILQHTLSYITMPEKLSNGACNIVNCTCTAFEGDTRRGCARPVCTHDYSARKINSIDYTK